MIHRCKKNQGSVPDTRPKLNPSSGTRCTKEVYRVPVHGSCQFFINTVHNSYLDWFSNVASKHPVFGKVTSGMDTLKKIETVKTSGGDRLAEPVKMVKISVNE